MLPAGERFDFVVNTTQVPGNYWLQGWPIGECGETAAVYAVLRYDGVPAEEPAEKRDVFNFESVREFSVVGFSSADQNCTDCQWRQLVLVKKGLLAMLITAEAVDSEYQETTTGI